jgi:hypothetical protein
MKNIGLGDMESLALELIQLHHLDIELLKAGLGQAAQIGADQVRFNSWLVSIQPEYPSAHYHQRSCWTLQLFGPPSSLMGRTGCVTPSCRAFRRWSWAAPPQGQFGRARRNGG